MPVYSPRVVFGSPGQVYKVLPNGVPDTSGICIGEGPICPGDPFALAGMFYFPHGLAVEPDGRIVVADSYNHRIQVFSPDGAHLFTLGGYGQVYFQRTDYALPELGPFQSCGAGQTCPGDPQQVLGLFNFPTGVAVDASGAILVADLANNRVQLLRPDPTAAAGDPTTVIASDGTRFRASAFGEFRQHVVRNI